MRELRKTVFIIAIKKTGTLYNMQRNSRKLLFFSILLVLVVTSTIMISEVILRIYNPYFTSTLFYPHIHQRDDQLGHKYKPNSVGWTVFNSEINSIVKINSWGFHDLEHKKKNEDGLRVMALGDSYTSGLYYAVTSSWPSILQRRLKKIGYPSAEVFNLGIDATGTDVHLALLKKYLKRIKPNLVILAFCENDIGDAQGGLLYRECYKNYIIPYQNEHQKEAIKTYIDKNAYSDITRFMFNKSYVFRALTWFLYGEHNILRENYLVMGRNLEYRRSAFEKKDISDKSTKELFQEFAELSLKYGFRLLVVPIPDKIEAEEGLRVLKNALRDLPDGTIEVCDVLPIMEKRIKWDNKAFPDVFFKTDRHVSVYGNKVFGLSIAEYIDKTISPDTLKQNNKR